MFKIIRNIRDGYRYNKYIATTARPPERETLAEFLDLARPIFEQHAHASGMGVTWDVPVAKVFITDYPLPRDMSADPEIQRRYNLQLDSKVGVTLRHKGDENDVQKGTIDILSSPHDGLLVAFRVPSLPNSTRYTKIPACLDYMLRHEREAVLNGFEKGVPPLISLREKKVTARAGGITAAGLDGGPGA